ncbi:MAG: cation:proton antiporter [Euryarchaeota archaeon]|nr:cation:proton antiporter [Euryarchaeota archaeon]
MAGEDVILASILIASAALVTERIARKVGLPPTTLYLVVGVVFASGGPSPVQPISLEMAQFVALGGIVLAFFALGTDVSIREVTKTGGVAAFITVIEVLVVLVLGFTLGQALGLSPIASGVLGAVMSISSTTLVLYSFRRENRDLPSKDVVVGVLLMEDVAAAALLAVFSALILSGSFSAVEVTEAMGQTALLMLVLVGLSAIAAPYIMRALVRSRRDWPIGVAASLLAVAAAVTSSELGFSPALGAFVMGAAVAQSVGGERLRRVVEMGRETALGLFFISMGLLMDPGVALSNLPAIGAIVAVAMLAKTIGAGSGFFLAGRSAVESVRIGATMGRYGTFAIVLSTVLGQATSEGALVFAAGTSLCLITSIVAPPYAAGVARGAIALHNRAPRELHLLSGYYAAWVGRARARIAADSPSGRKARSVLRRVFVSALFLAILVNLTVLLARIVPGLVAAQNRTNALLIVWVGATLLSIPAFFSLFTSLQTLYSLLVRPEGERARLLRSAAGAVLLLVALVFTVVIVVFFASRAAVSRELLLGVGIVVLAFAVLFWGFVTRLHEALEGQLHVGFFEDARDTGHPPRHKTGPSEGEK